MADAPFFHDASGTVRFSVTVEGQDVSASIGREVLRYHYRTAENADPLATYGQHIEEFDAAVRRRLAAGSSAPIMLRENDLRAPA
ncbi:hypothetical protein J2W34_001950 [Variovorax boronicumulans]|uniref:DUF1488 family protein n=1 Tax=Variovorax boronicumulans TaxID=436515 RepID=UPI00278AA004|nr:DUF1488 family protein [Variovorax boronicumulans]MDQ0070165.1 hypothetical protein [Variovorax boronicumulans]